MAFNDIRIPRIDDATFKKIKKSAEKNTRKINQEALALIKQALEQNKKTK